MYDSDTELLSAIDKWRCLQVLQSFDFDIDLNKISVNKMQQKARRKLTGGRIKKYHLIIVQSNTNCLFFLLKI